MGLSLEQCTLLATQSTYLLVSSPFIGSKSCQAPVTTAKSSCRARQTFQECYPHSWIRLNKGARWGRNWARRCIIDQDALRWLLRTVYDRIFEFWWAGMSLIGLGLTPPGLLQDKLCIFCGRWHWIAQLPEGKEAIDTTRPNALYSWITPNLTPNIAHQEVVAFIPLSKAFTLLHWRASWSCFNSCQVHLLIVVFALTDRVHSIQLLRCLDPSKSPGVGPLCP